MKKLLILAAMLALALATAIPATAQVSNEFAQEAESEDLETNFSVENTGDYASQCTPAIQFGNTGNLNNGSSFVQYVSESDDFEPGGLAVGFGAGQSTECANTIQQSSAASGS